ncbi:MAG TPA: hypothetical protein GXZ48_05580 [Acholeplasmataceae bacterium]|nr:hypothetical protein [Acholeplasmataceae bacterium]
MKKYIILIIIIIAIVLLLYKPENEELRIRIIANSNSSIDQQMKDDVANKLKKTLKETRNLSIIKEDVEYVISKYDVNYEVNVEIKDQKFPPKYLGDEVIPGGVYKTLVIEIGKAQGKNYWSILYPEYFNCSFEDVNSGDVEFRWWIIDILKGE